MPVLLFSEKSNELSSGFCPRRAGSTLRYVVNVVCPRLFGPGFPYHTFIINITGSTVTGLIAGLALARHFT